MKKWFTIPAVTCVLASAPVWAQGAKPSGPVPRAADRIPI